MRRAVAPLITALLWVATPLVAHEHATGIVKERMDAMEDMSRAVKRINQRLKARRNWRAVEADAELVRRAAERIPSWFPPGSGRGSDAAGAIWARWPQFVEAAGLLEREAAALAAVARSGAETEIATRFRALTGACTACHDAFRTKR